MKKPKGPFQLIDGSIVQELRPIPGFVWQCQMKCDRGGVIKEWYMTRTNAYRPGKRK
jgi:hypothetical protein